MSQEDAIHIQLKQYRKDKKKAFTEKKNLVRLLPYKIPLGPKIITVSNDFARKCLEYEENVERKLNEKQKQKEEEEEEEEVSYVTPYLGVFRTMKNITHLKNTLKEKIPSNYDIKTDSLYDYIQYNDCIVKRFYSKNFNSLGIIYDDVFRLVKFSRVECVRSFISVNVRLGLIQPSISISPNLVYEYTGKKANKIMPMSALIILVKHRSQLIT